MIRWRFVLTRMMIVMVVIVLLRWGLGPVANYATIRGIESATGAKVEIGETRVGLFPPSIHYSDVHIADPRSDKELRDAVTADSIEFVLDGDALLNRRLIAREGRIQGIQIGAKRATSGHIASRDEPVAEKSGPSMLSRLLGATTDRVANQADAIVDESETVLRGKEIRDRWELQYQDLIVRARSLEKKIRDVRDRARGIDNPLRDWPEFERTLADARDARSELLAVQQELNSLPQRLQVDLAQLNEAKQIDIAKVDKFVPGDLSGTSEFGVAIMAEAVRKQIQQVRAYVDGGRAIAGITFVAPEQSRIRGYYHDLEPLHRPQVMIRRCEVSGVLRADGDVYTMTGVVENATPTPELLAEPTRTRLSLEGPETLRVEFVRDRRGTSDIDRLTVHWPTMDAESIRLGDDQNTGIAVEGGERELWVQMRTEGDQIEGRLVSKQTGVRMELNVDPKLAQSAAVASLRDSLSTVDRIEVDARFAGTWKNIDLELNTNLNQIMRRATRDAIDGQLRQTRELMTTKINKIHAEQTAELRDWLGKQQGEALSLLANADKSIEEMSAKVFDEVGTADKYLGKLRGAIQGKLR
jgi:uncharacterized protein (TIGR03545 family)